LVSDLTPDEIIARLLYRDGLMLVLDKPAGFAVHKGPKGGKSLEDYFGALRFGLPRAPALAHRLDRDTSGCLVLGRHRKALAELGRLFKSGRIAKTYWALVEGGPAADEGRIDLPLGRKDATRGWWMKHDPQGQPAVTTWKVLGRTPTVAAPGDPVLAGAETTGAPSPACGGGSGWGHTPRLVPACPLPIPPPQAGEGVDRTSRKGSDHLTWLALEPLTGRTHQLRVHCAAMGWPILGDSVYGTAPRAGGPVLHLHAREIVVPLYKNRAPIKVIAPVPPHMQSALRACGWRDDSSG
jgi:tRNA pseudouridine32 synthase / 23S rRNA pseudouridine746 synthase